MNKPTKTSISIFTLSMLLVLTGCSTPDETQNEQEFQYRSQLKSFNSCDELSTYLLDTAEQERKLYDFYETDVRILGAPVSIDGTEDVVLASESGAAAPAPAAESDSAISDFTGTNNQVAGVDEADFVKTDGEYTYIVTGGHLVILDNWPAAESKELSRVKFEGAPSNLFAFEDVVWVVSNIYDYKYQDLSTDALVSFAPRVNQLTSVTLFDVSDREDPEIIRETTMEGYFVDARRVKNRVHLVTSAQIDIYPLLQEEAVQDIDKLLPVMTDKLHDPESEATTEVVSDCGNIYRPETANGTGTISLFSFDLSDPKADIKRQSIISNSGTVYASQQNLYLATIEDRYWAWLPVLDGDVAPRPGTIFHKFSLADKPEYLASGRVDGHIINQFAMDEYDGLLRTVTTVDAWWAEGDPINSLYVLEQSGKQLVQRSKLTDLGKKGERIYAARFIEDKGFLVTFLRIDPLYTLDLSDPDNPEVAGELEVPGFSTYLHPLEGDLILAIGRSVTDNSINLSLFDISDFSNPALLHSKSIGYGSYSEAEYNHKAFTWFAGEDLLALPVSRWNFRLADGYSDVFNGLQLYTVDKENGFEKYGEVDHSDFYRDEDELRWYYPQNIRRSFFVTDDSSSSFLYSISNRGMKVNSLPKLETLAALPLPVYDWENILYAE